VPGDRLDWYRNIPVPTSYMCLNSAGDFFGGYDHRAQAGFVHWADHHVAVGKKQWSWGDAPFGHAWNRNLTDDDSAYIELMAGVYTDNQPDFSHLAPGETKTFSQFWYPVAGTGPVVAAGLDAALGVTVEEGTTTLSWDVTRPLPEAVVTVRNADFELLDELAADLVPDQRLQRRLGTSEPLQVELWQRGRRLLSWSTPRPDPESAPAAQPATEPAPPEEIGSVEQLYLVGRHLVQYRHATRSPEPYWREALRRDPGHAGSHTALADRRYRQGLFGGAERHLRAAIARLTSLNPNPAEGEAHHLLGLTLTQLGRDDEAYAAFAKAAWVRAWVAPANHQLAVLDARAGRTATALSRAEAALRAEPEQLQVRNLRVVLLRRLGRTAEADRELATLLDLDPLDVLGLHQAGRLDERCGLLEAQTLLDVGCEYARVGEDDAALDLFARARLGDAKRPRGQTGCALLADYHAALVLHRRGDATAAREARDRARGGDRTWNFPSRLDDVAALRQALALDPSDATASALLGHWSYAQGRTEDAIGCWQRSLAEDPRDAVVWRNLGIALYNHRGDAEAARSAYDHALALAPGDAQLWYESDQLLKRVGAPAALRLARLETGPVTITDRDDLSVEYAHLLVTTGRPDEALRLLAGRRFQPWEGGEGQVLRAWERTQLALAERALADGDAPAALAHAEATLHLPEHLGEERHPLANPAQLLLALAEAANACGNESYAEDCWQRAAHAVGDFAAMAPHTHSENTYYSVLAARALGEVEVARSLTDGLAEHVARLASTPARVDYFATSLPTVLLFDEDPQRRQDIAVDLLQAQLALLRGDHDAAGRHLARVLDADPGHDLALDLNHHLERTVSLS
jgi:tetratricopeptide (TPR) repeat protein